MVVVEDEEGKEGRIERPKIETNLTVIGSTVEIVVQVLEGFTVSFFFVSSVS